MESTDNNQPVAPAESPAADGKNTKKKSKLGLVLGLTIGGGVLVLGGILTLILVLVLGGVSRQDFRAAADQTRKIGTLVSSDGSFATSISSALQSGDFSPSTIKSIQDFQSSLKKEMNTLSTMRAIKNDRDAKTKFDAMQAAYEKYDQDISLTIKLLDEASPALTAILKLADDFSNFNYSDINDFKQFATSAHDIAKKCTTVKTGDGSIDQAFQDFGQAYEAFAAALDQFIANPSSENNDALSATSTKVATVSATAMTTLNKASDPKVASNFTDTINALGSYLTDRANGNKQ